MSEPQAELTQMGFRFVVMLTFFLGVGAFAALEAAVANGTIEQTHQIAIGVVVVGGLFYWVLRGDHSGWR